MRTGEQIAKFAEAHVGIREGTERHAEIINIYNKNSGRPRGVKMTTKMPWCATFWSYLALCMGWADLLPVECSCGELIKQAQKMGIWVEDDAFVPPVGAGILYDWDDNGKGDCKGWPEHIGMVTQVSSGRLKIVEGNYKDAVSVRYITPNARYIRGYIVPKYDKQPVTTPDENLEALCWQVIRGQWGNGADRKARLERAGWNYEVVRRKINEMKKAGLF